MLAALLNWLKQVFRPQVRRLTLEDLQLHKRHLSALASLQPDQLEAIAQLGRLLATLIREEQKSEGVVFYWDQLAYLHQKHRNDREKQLKKIEAKAKQESRAKPLTWNDAILRPQA